MVCTLILQALRSSVCVASSQLISGHNEYTHLWNRIARVRMPGNWGLSMKLSLRRPTTSPELSEPLRHHLKMYALAASAAGVSALALVQPAQAEIIYTPANKHLPVNRYFHLDLNHDGTNDFRFRFVGALPGTGFNFSLYLSGSQQANEVWTTTTYFGPCAAALPKETKVGPGSPLKKAKKLQMAWSASSGFGGGGAGCPWLSVNGGIQAYLGLKFTFKGEVHYGWARFGEVLIGNQSNATLTGYAYESTPGKAIITGKTKGPDVIIAQPATLGRLALGRK
jgi:hypothetical protein